MYRLQPPALTDGHPSQKRARSITTEAASRVLIAAIHLVFVSIRRRFTATQPRPRACGGPVIMIMRRANSDVGVQGIRGIPGIRGITGIEDARFPPAALTVETMVSRIIGMNYLFFARKTLASTSE